MSTASALERELACPTSVVLGPVSRETSEHAERGTAIHVFCRSVIAGTPRSLALAQVPEGPWRETCEQIDFAVLCGGLIDVRAEVAYRVNIETDEVRELGINLGRRYPKREAHDVDGTNDFEGRRPIGGRWVVTDIKTGQHVTRCQDNPQMKFHARALMLLHGVDEVEGRVAYIDVGGEIRMDVHVFGRLELDVFNDELVARRERIARANEALQSGGKVAVNAGSWCTYCEALISCPHHHALAAAMLGKLRETHVRWATLAEDERGAAVLHAYEARDLAERIIKSVKTMARANPIALGDGKELRETSSGVRVVNAPKPERRGRGRRVA